MLTHIIQKEIKDIIASSKFVLSFIVSSLLIILTFYVGAKNYHVSRLQYDAAVRENLGAMEGLSDWRMANHKIFLPPEPLSSLVSGVSNDIGRNIEMYGRGELTAKDSKYGEEPIYAAFRFLDLEFLFQVILSLFAILFCYNAINGEKEQGTLRLVFSNSVPRARFIFGKLSGSFLALSVPLLIPVMIGFLLLNIMNVPMDGSDWMKLMLVILSGLLYFGVFLSASVFVSALTQKSSHSFLLMLVVWIFAVLIIPRSAVLLAGRAVSVPSVDEINTQKSKMNMQLSDELFKKLAGFKSTSKENLMQEFQKHMEVLNEEKDTKYKSFSDKLEEVRRNRQEVQERLAFNLSRISPSACFSLAASNLAGTSLDLQKKYLEQAKAYQDIYKKFQAEKSGGTSGGGMTFVIRTDNDKPPLINPAELPKFKYHPEPFAAVFVRALPDIALLIIFNIIFFFGSFVAFLKYDLR